MKRVKPAEVILAALPGTKMQLAESAGLHKATAIRTVNRLHAAGQIHIGRWMPHPVRGPTMPVYVAGPGKDAADALPRLSRQQISQRHEAKIKGTETMDARRARQRNRWWEKKAATTKQTWLSALTSIRAPKQTKSNEAASSANN
jgi:hypothetical protein